jgi:hypothetical protein
MSAPDTSTRALPHWSRIGVAVHATVRSSPPPVIHRDSRSACGTPFAAPPIAMRAANSSSRATRSRNDVPSSSANDRPNVSIRARFAPCGTMIASWSVITMKLGIVSATVLAKFH